mgnify:CR=1 FL=1|jgi:hypothetical protein
MVFGGKIGNEGYCHVGRSTIYVYSGDQLGVDHVLLILLTYVDLYVDFYVEAIGLPCKLTYIVW